MTSKQGNILRIVAIVSMGMTAVFTMLGGVGTGCVAFNADQYGKAFEVFVPYMTTYQVFVYVLVTAGMVGVVVTYALVRGDKWAYWGAVIILAVGVVVAIIHMYYTSTVKEISFFDTAPTSMRLYITSMTLVLFLVLRYTGLRKQVDFTGPWPGKGSRSAASGLAAVVAGITTITTPVWAGASHMFEGENLVNVLFVPLILGGGFMVLMGVNLLAPTTLGMSRKQMARLFSAELRRRYNRLRYAR